MASHAPSNCCAKGFKHEGTPSGKLTSVNGVESYVTGDATGGKVLVMLTDVWGHKYINAQLVADQFASEGYYVIVPDLFEGDPVPRPEHQPAGFDMKRDWLPSHQPNKIKPIVDQVMKHVEEAKPKLLAATGYCFGAKFVVQLLGEAKVDVGAVAHPSFVTLDEIRAIKKPLFISAAETDQIYTDELRHDTEQALKEIGATYFTTLACGVSHGFACRGDPNKPAERYAKEKAVCDWVGWFDHVSQLKSGE